MEVVAGEKPEPIPVVAKAEEKPQPEAVLETVVVTETTTEMTQSEETAVVEEHVEHVTSVVTEQTTIQHIVAETIHKNSNGERFAFKIG